MLSNSDWLIITNIHILLWIFFYRFKRKKVDPLDSFYLSSGLYWLIFVYAPYIWMSRGQTSYQGVEVMRYMPEAMLVFNVGYFVFAYASIAKRRFVDRTLKYEQEEYVEFILNPYMKKCILRYGWTLFGIGMCLSLFYYSITGRGLIYMLTLGQGEEYTIGSSGLGIYFLAQFIRLAIPGLILIILFQEKLRIVKYIMIYVICAVCVSSGSRNLAICVVLAIAVINYIKKGKKPKLWTVLLAVILMFLFVGFVGIFRGDMKTGGDIDLSLINLDSLNDAFMFNVEIFYPFFTLIGYVPNRVSLHRGLGILNIAIQFIPRAIWPSKPATLGKTSFESMYGDSMGGAAYPNIGEFYYELGLAGIIFFMFIFGRKMRKSYDKTMRSKNPITWATYAIQFGYIMQFICRGHFASWALDMFFMFVPLSVLQIILYKKYTKVTKIKRKLMVD